MGPTKTTKTTNHYPLKQIEYRSFLRPIELYHFPHRLFSLSQLDALCATLPSFIRRLESPDTLCNPDGSEKNHVPAGDEVPPGTTEVAYLWNVFRDGGSALGFRLLDEDRIEWMLFSGPIDQFLSTAAGGNGVRLFDRVAELPRGEPGSKMKGTVKGYPEHRQWYEGLAVAVGPVLSLEAVERNRARGEEVKAGGSAEDSARGDSGGLECSNSEM